MDEKVKSLSLDEVMCPVCLDIFIEPITMSCSHELCNECYQQHFKNCNFECPMCKKRLSTWARRASAQGKLINKSKWAKIQEEYPDLVARRLDGKSNSQTFMQTEPVDLSIAEPGELQEEYLTMRQEWLLESSSQRREQEEASLNLIKQIQEEEKNEIERRQKIQQEADQQLAIKLSKELEMNVSPSLVNKIILRPRKVLTSICENSPNTSEVKRKSMPISTRKTRKRKRSQV
uniref:E3 ubiquitin-protein ligase rnf168-like n=1 Tax=Styela clava TaxID=7725 RepID=UPI00193AD482|nr:E3 ubiquitin-protein ligase rnf168-like [Styela clava]